MSLYSRGAGPKSMNSVPATASLKVADVDAFVQSRLAASASQDAEQRTAAVASTATVIARAFDNEAARKEPQSTLATIARLQGNNAAKALRAIALGEAERQRALCNTPEGLKQCHAVIEFLVALHHRVAVDCRGLPSAAARAARILWAESYLSGMRYGVHRTLVKLFDQLSLDNGKTKIKSKSLYQQIGRETGFAPTEHGLHALTVALFRQLWRYSQDSESYALSALVSSAPVGAPTLSRISSGSNSKLRGAFTKKQAVAFDSMEHALRAAFAARTDGRALFLCYLHFAEGLDIPAGASGRRTPDRQRAQASAEERIVMTEDASTQTAAPAPPVDAATSSQCPDAHTLPVRPALPRDSRDSARAHSSDPGRDSEAQLSAECTDLLRLGDSTAASRRSNGFVSYDSNGVDAITGLRHAHAPAATSQPHNPFLTRHSTGMQPARSSQASHLPAAPDLAESYQHALQRMSVPALPPAAAAYEPVLPYMVSAPASWAAPPPPAHIPLSPRPGPAGGAELQSPSRPQVPMHGLHAAPDLQRYSWAGPAAGAAAAQMPAPVQAGTPVHIGRTSNNPFA